MVFLYKVTYNSMARLISSLIYFLKGGVLSGANDK
nr:MAG TPA: hypothetical protein [Caudoviricetes sp.]DAO63372.1 MAG TPA: hypothetical protein [Caudoviricetes sp.]